MTYWLVKCEPTTYSISDLKKDRKTCWDGVRNYQARNFLMEMKKGDELLFYHSVTEPIGVAGIARVSRPAYPDPSQFDSKSRYFDPASSPQKPRWFSPEVSFVRIFKEVLGLSDLRKEAPLKNMELMKKGSRLSVQPVTEDQYRHILSMAEKRGL